ncbi:MAG: EfeM/EfeO family lipoprotein [Planctomycetota bacterium]
MMTPNMLERRTLLKASIIGLPALAAAGCQTHGGHGGDHGHSHASDSPALAEAVTKGVAYFQKRCKDQLPLVKKLHAAIKSGDLKKAQAAYVESRPPYEEIETTALCFEDADSDIDARPYAFEGGETDPEFRGFHKIEAYLYGYEDLKAAEPFAAGLVKSVEGLQKNLAERGRFNAGFQFDGMVGLANEVAAKKISSEEETWSDQSLLIFWHNWIGIASQFKPFEAALNDGKKYDAVLKPVKDGLEMLKPHKVEGTAGFTPYSKIGMAERRKMANTSNRLRDALMSAREAIGV